jgi:signal transduction histidine kinase
MSSTQPSSEILRAYTRYTVSGSIRNSKVACVLVIVLMPAGALLDYFVYPGYLWYFFKLRLLCSALTALVLLGLSQPRLVERHYRLLCMGWYVLPAFIISWMIAATDGATSPYYAGLNLVILAASSIIQATFIDSLVAVSLIFLMYLGACFLAPSFDDGRMFVNNIYFIALTAIIVVTGNFFFNRLRLREFALRFELDENRQKLEESNAKLVELDQVKSRFFANVSHELRTPLTLLLSPLESLLHQRGSTFDPDTRELLATMQTNGMRLLKLINDLLDLVRIESGHMEVKREPLAVEEFLCGLGNAVRRTAEDRRIKLEITVDERVGTILADSDKLEKILLNLIFNALKFTPAGGTVQIRVERQNEEMVLRVSDTGMGITDQKLPFIFDRFWQADTSLQRKYQGVGIGLALVKELVEVQGGKVAVNSRTGKGTQFTVYLPYLRAQSVAPVGLETVKSAAQSISPEAPTEAGNGNAEEWLKNLYRRAEFFPSMTPLQERLRPVETLKNDGRPRLLIADDEPDMLRFLRSQLRDHFQLLEAVDGQQAIEKASQFLPDVILCDMMMPVKNGVEVCRELRERTPTQGIPIILLTAWADEETKLTALSVGASDFLSKPFSTTELHVRLNNLVKSHQLQQKLARQNQILEATLEQLKDTEIQLVQSEKLASLGRMSVGIIHEINNPLNFAKTGLYTLRKLGNSLAELEKPDFEEILTDVEDGINRVKNIVWDLRTFTQPSVAQFEDIAVTEIVNSTLRLFCSEWKGKVRIEQHIPEDQTIHAIRNQISQVIVNLLQNALDALKNKTFYDGEPTIRIEGLRKGGQSLILVRDNGEGISADNLNKIFDPFFTTKDVGEGMGLGLSICYRIMEQHGGRIQVKSEQGKYCEVVLAFPEKREGFSQN